MTIIANFKQGGKANGGGATTVSSVCTLTVNKSEGGWVSQSGAIICNLGADITVTATPDTANEYKFSGWTGSAATSKDANKNPITIFMDESKTLTAKFTKDGELPPTPPDTTGTDTTTVVKKTFTVTFYINDGGDDPRVFVVDSGTVFTSFPNNEDRPGYKILGFFDENGNEFKYGTIITRDMVINGKWEESSQPIDYGTFTDTRNGTTYRTVEIGTQTWMADNLNYKTDDSWCYGEGKSGYSPDDSCNKYGRLYTWEAAKTACPTGWHLPTKQEWQILVDYAGGENNAGKYLKSQTGWNYFSDEIQNLNTYGFSALPGGSYLSGSDYYNAGYDGNWWTASEYGYGYSYYMNMYNGFDKVFSFFENVSIGFGISVRCVADY